MKYRGITERGREAIADSLQEAVVDITATAGYDPARAVTAKSDDEDVWYVYASQVGLDIDLQRGRITRRSPGWFAVIECTP